MPYSISNKVKTLYNKENLPNNGNQCNDSSPKHTVKPQINKAFLLKHNLPSKALPGVALKRNFRMIEWLHEMNGMQNNYMSEEQAKPFLIDPSAQSINRPDGVYMLVKDIKGHLYLLPDNEIRKHSFVVAGGNVEFSGFGYVKNGKLVAASNNSGHYQLTHEEAITGLKTILPYACVVKKDFLHFEFQNIATNQQIETYQLSLSTDGQSDNAAVSVRKADKVFKLGSKGSITNAEQSAMTQYALYKSSRNREVMDLKPTPFRLTSSVQAPKVIRYNAQLAPDIYKINKLKRQNSQEALRDVKAFIGQIKERIAHQSQVIVNKTRRNPSQPDERMTDLNTVLPVSLTQSTDQLLRKTPESYSQVVKAILDPDTVLPSKVDIMSVSSSGLRSNSSERMRISSDIDSTELQPYQVSSGSSDYSHSTEDDGYQIPEQAAVTNYVDTSDKNVKHSTPLDYEMPKQATIENRINPNENLAPAPDHFEYEEPEQATIGKRTGMIF